MEFTEELRLEIVAAGKHTVDLGGGKSLVIGRRSVNSIIGQNARTGWWSISFYAAGGAWVENSAQFFSGEQSTLAIETYVLRANSLNPEMPYSDATHRQFSLKDLPALSSGKLQFRNYYDYLELVVTPFLNVVLGGHLLAEDDDWSGVIAAHADKADQYTDDWAAVDISAGRGALLYLLSHTSYFPSDYKRHNVHYWVMGQYGYFKDLIEKIEADILRQRYGIEPK